MCLPLRLDLFAGPRTSPPGESSCSEGVMVRLSRSPLVVVIALAAASFSTGCKKSEPKEVVSLAPPVAEVTPGVDACATPGAVDDAMSSALFPNVVAGACLDPKGDTRTFGDRAKSTLEELCTTAFDGECEVYRGFGVKRVVGVRYVENLGKQGTVEVYVNQFATSAGALGMFTKRVVGESDPSDAQAPKSFGAGERSGLGTGRGYVWKGSYLVELTYTNDDGTLTQDAFKAAADALLAPLGKAIGANLPADATPIPSVSALPVGSLVPGGVNFFPTDGFRIPHLGPVAEGFYRDGAKRFRMFAIARTDANDAKADMRLFKTRPKAKPESGIGDEAVSVELNGGQGAGGSSYVVARMGSTILGVGTEPFASDATLDDAARKTRLTGLAQSLTHKP